MVMMMVDEVAEFDVMSDLGDDFVQVDCDYSSSSEDEDEEDADSSWNSSSSGSSVLNASSSNLKDIKMPQCSWFGAAQEQGLRNTMEDYVQATTLECRGRQLLYAGVFDGHNGSETSLHLHQLLHKRIQTVLNEENIEISAALQRTFLDFDLELLEQVRATTPPKTETPRHNKVRLRRRLLTDPCQLRHPGGCSGSTGTVVVVGESRVWVAWLGDSRAVLCRNQRAFPLTTDHRAAALTEKERIEACGGTVSTTGRLFHDLNLSRAFGSFHHKMHELSSSPTSIESDRQVQMRNPLSAVPDMLSVERIPGQQDFIVIASDGLWDVLPNEQVVQFVERNIQLGVNTTEIANQLVQEALKRGTTDNVSAIIVNL